MNTHTFHSAATRRAAEGQSRDGATRQMEPIKRRSINLKMRDAQLTLAASNSRSDGLPVLDFLFERANVSLETFLHPTAEWSLV